MRHSFRRHSYVIVCNNILHGIKRCAVPIEGTLAHSHIISGQAYLPLFCMEIFSLSSRCRRDLARCANLSKYPVQTGLFQAAIQWNLSSRNVPKRMHLLLAGVYLGHAEMGRTPRGGAHFDHRSLYLSLFSPPFLA